MLLLGKQLATGKQQLVAVIIPPWLNGKQFLFFRISAAAFQYLG